MFGTKLGRTQQQHRNGYRWVLNINNILMDRMGTGIGNSTLEVGRQCSSGHRGNHIRRTIGIEMCQGGQWTLDALMTWDKGRYNTDARKRRGVREHIFRINAGVGNKASPKSGEIWKHWKYWRSEAGCATLQGYGYEISEWTGSSLHVRELAIGILRMRGVRDHIGERWTALNTWKWRCVHVLINQNKLWNQTAGQ